MDIFLPEDLEEEVNDFQAQVLITKISTILNEYKLGFDCDDYFLDFEVNDLNLKLKIDYTYILRNSDYTSLDYFSWIIKYLEKLESILNEGGNILSSLSHFTTIDEDGDINDYCFISWDILNSDLNILK